VQLCKGTALQNVSTHIPGQPSLGSSSLLHHLRQCLSTATIQQQAVAGAQQLGNSSWRQALKDLKQLSKFRLSALVALTGSAGFVAGSGEQLDWAGLAWTSLGTMGAACSANALNQLYEISNDARMRRTSNRPLPSGRMSPAFAAGFALASGAAGLGILYFKTNELTAGLGAANIMLYAGVYTPLKQLTVANTWVGALVGAIPPLMGWASAAGQLEWGAGVLAAALFSWQMPHFMALAWLCKEDYMRGSFRMLSALDSTGKRTAGVGFRHALLLLPLGLVAHCANVATPMFGWEAASLAALLALPAASFARAPSTQGARSLFRASLLYLPLLMLGLVVHRVPNDHTMDLQQIRERAVAAVPFRMLDVEGSGIGAAALNAYRLLAASAVLTAAAGGRVLGISTSALGELRCPSKAQCKAADQDSTSMTTSATHVLPEAGISSSSSSSSNSSSSNAAPTSVDSDSSGATACPSEHDGQQPQVGAQGAQGVSGSQGHPQGVVELAGGTGPLWSWRR